MLLNEQEMMRLWLLRKGHEPLRSDCRIERSDGADLATYARSECRLAMERLLAEGDPSLLVLHDLAKEPPGLKFTMTLVPSMITKLPDDCVRPVAVKLRSWLAPAEILPASAPGARRQYAAYSRGGIVNPVAVIHPDNRLELFSPAYDDNDTLEYLLCAMRQRDDEGLPLYEFQPRALNVLCPTEGRDIPL